MKICIIVSSLLIGGSSQVVVDLATGLKNKNNDIVVVSIWNLIDDKYKNVLRRSNIEFLSSHKKNKFDFFCYKNLRDIFIKYNFDIIITNLTSVFYCWLCRPKSQIVHIIHSEPERDLPWLYRKLLIRDIKKGKIKLVGCSNSVARKAKKLYKVEVEKINNGIFLPKLINGSKTYDFVYVGRLCKTKRLFDLLKAFKCLQQRINEATLCLVGDGPLQQKIKQFIATNNILNVSLVGKTDNVYDYLIKSKVFCLFSSYEGGPICLLEAMSCGLPIVCSNVDGNLNFAIDNTNSLVFPVGNIKKATELMYEYLTNQELYNSHSNNSLILSRNYSVTNMVDSYYCYLAKLMGKGV